MWALAAGSLSIWLFDPLGMISGTMGLAALGLAIALVCTKHRAHRIHGWVYIGLSCLGTIVMGLIVAGLIGLALQGAMRLPEAAPAPPATSEWPTENRGP